MNLRLQRVQPIGSFFAGDILRALNLLRHFELDQLDKIFLVEGLSDDTMVVVVAGG